MAPVQGFSVLIIVNPQIKLKNYFIYFLGSLNLFEDTGYPNFILWTILFLIFTLLFLFFNILNYFNFNPFFKNTELKNNVQWWTPIGIAKIFEETIDSSTVFCKKLTFWFKNKKIKNLYWILISSVMYGYLKTTPWQHPCPTAIPYIPFFKSWSFFGYLFESWPIFL